MEAIGLAASIVQLLETLDNVISYLRAVKDAPREKSDLLAEIRYLSARLTKLQCKYEDSIRGSNESWFAGIKTLGIPLDQLNTALETLLQHVTEHTGIAKAFSSLKWPLDKKRVREYLDKVQRVQVMIVLALQEDLSELALAIKDDTKHIPALQHLLLDVDTKVTQLRFNQHEIETRTITEWLSPLNLFSAQADNHAISQRGTGSWFFNHVTFEQWKSQPGRSLWAPGIPGAGKTILTSIIVNKLLHDHKNNHEVAVGVAYCSYRDHQDQSVLNILCGLWRQMIRGVSEHSVQVKALYKTHTQFQSRPSLAEICQVVNEELSRHIRSYIFIDALDELPHVMRKELVGALLSLRPKPNLLFTSRKIDAIGNLIMDKLTLEIRAQGQDITEYVTAQIQQNDRLSQIVKKFPDLHNETISVIARISGSMFLLAKLYLDNLAVKARVRDYRNALKTLPAGLEATYDAALHRIQQADESQTALKALYWISSAVRPVTLDELQHALAVEPGDTVFDEENVLLDDITSLCAGLIEVSPNTSIVRLAHYTTLDYLKRKEIELFPGSSNEIAMTCLTYLTLEDLKPHISRSASFQLPNYGLRVDTDSDEEGFSPTTQYITANKGHHLHRYAARYWGRHYLALPEPDERLKSKALQFLQLDYRPSDEILLYDKNMWGYMDPKLTGFHLVAYHNLIELAHELGKVKSYTSCESDWVSSPLDWAADLDRMEIAEIFIRAGADPTNSGNAGFKAIHHAARNGHADFVRMLIDHGVDPNLKTSDKTEGKSPIHEAAWWNRIETARVLIEHGADVNAGLYLRPEYTPLAFMLINHQYDALPLIKLLVEAGAVINTDIITESVINNGTIAFLQSLMELGFTLNPAPGTQKHALDLALKRGDRDVVKFLVNNGAVCGVHWQADNPYVFRYKNEDWFDALERSIQNNKADDNITSDISLSQLRANDASIEATKI